MGDLFPGIALRTILALSILIGLCCGFTLNMDLSTNDKFAKINISSVNSTNVTMLAGDPAQVAAYWYNQRVDISQGFSTQYTWTWSDSAPNDTGDGISFVIHNNVAGLGFITTTGCNWGFRKPAIGDADPLAFGTGMEGETQQDIERYIFAVSGDQTQMTCLDRDNPALWTAVESFPISKAPVPATFIVKVTWDALNNSFSASYALLGVGFIAALNGTVNITRVVGNTTNVWVGFTAATGLAAHSKLVLQDIWSFTTPFPYTPTQTPIPTPTTSTASPTPTPTAPHSTVISFGDGCSGNGPPPATGFNASCTVNGSVIVINGQVFIPGGLQLSDNSTVIIKLDESNSVPLTVEGCFGGSGVLIVTPGQAPSQNSSVLLVNSSCINSTFATVQVDVSKCNVDAEQQIGSSGLAVLLIPSSSCSRGKGKLPNWAIGLIVAGAVLGAVLLVVGLLLILRQHGHTSCLFNSKVY